MLLSSCRPALPIAQNGAKQRLVKATTLSWLKAESREVHYATDDAEGQIAVANAILDCLHWSGFESRREYLV